MEPGYVYVPYTPIAGIYAAIAYPHVRKKIMFVKEWLEEKRKNQHAYHSIDAETELTKMLTEQFAKEFEKQKNVNKSWIDKNIRKLD
jgi:hypothetical protein